MNGLHKLTELCKGKYIYIETHSSPDSNAIASAFGLQRLLELHNVKFTLCYGGWLDTISELFLQIFSRQAPHKWKGIEICLTGKIGL